MIASSIPSYWSDEVTTLRAARLGWPELFDFLGHKDAVHTAYYSVMKLWLGLFGESEFAARSLSALAVASRVFTREPPNPSGARCVVCGGCECRRRVRANSPSGGGSEGADRVVERVACRHRLDNSGGAGVR